MQHRQYFARISRWIMVSIFVVTSVIPFHGAYAAPSLSIVNATYPLLPVANEPPGMVRVGNYLYMMFGVSGTNGFRIMDVSSVTAPTVVGGTALSIPANATKHIVVSGNYAYIAGASSGEGGSAGISVIDISNPALPSLVGESLSYSSFDTKDIIISGNYLYVALTNGVGTTWFRVIDISNPLSITEVGSNGSLSSAPNQLSKSGNYVFVAHTGSAGKLSIMDVSTPASPTIVGTPITTLPTAGPLESVIDGSYLYILYETTGTSMFRIVDISNPLAPTVVGGSSLNLSEEAFALAVSGTSVFLALATVSGADYTNPKIQTVDASTSSSLTLGSSVGLGSLIPGALMISGQYIYSGQIIVPDEGTSTGILRIINTVATASSSFGSDFTPPDAPTKIVATSDGKTATITWVDPTASDLSRIEILRNAGGTTPVDGGNVLDVIAPGTRKFTDTGVVPGQTYQYQLRAKDTSGNASVSDVVTVKVEQPQPVAPPAVTQSPASPSPTPTPTIPPSATPVIFYAKEDFFKNGTLATASLGAGERESFWIEFNELHGREPSVAELDLMSNGQIHERSLDLEKRLMSEVLPLWQKLTGKKSLTNISDREQQIFDTMVYRLRFPRDIEQEKVGLTKFIRLFQHLPKTPIDWAAVRVLGYIK